MNTDLANSLWFTGSTIAQTLSGSMGLLGAIMLFALQEAARSIHRAAQQLSEIPHASMNAHYLRHLLTRRSFHELARLYGEELQPGGSGETSVELLAVHSTLTWELEHDRLLRRAFWKALMASGVVVAFAIASCGLSPQLAYNASIGQMVIFLMIAGAVGCLILYGFLLRVIFRGSTEEVKPGARP
jgi:hypothetical protein